MKSQDAGLEETQTARRRKISDALIEFAKSLEHSAGFGMPERTKS